MNRKNILLFCAVWISGCSGKEPLKPADGSIRFTVYFPSYYRGICVGTLVSRTAVLTAAICVTNPVAITDRRPINVVLGTTYRHTRRGIRIQVTKVLIPNLSTVSGERGYLLEKSAAILLLKRKIPDVLMESPSRPMYIDYTGEIQLTLQEECFMTGWHFFFKGDIIYPPHRFLLQRNLRLQFLNIVKKPLYCETLMLKHRQALNNLGFHGYFDESASICVRDGMYGAPLICRGRVVGLMMSPDAQWSNCTGFSNVIHLLRSKWLRSFFLCVHKLFEVDDEDVPDWYTMKKNVYALPEADVYDYVETLYDHLYSQSDSDGD